MGAFQPHWRGQAERAVSGSDCIRFIYQRAGIDNARDQHE
jgi:hypothetical protein